MNEKLEKKREYANCFENDCRWYIQFTYFKVRDSARNYHSVLL